MDNDLTIGTFNTIAANDYYRPYLFRLNFNLTALGSLDAVNVASTQTPTTTTTVQNIDYLHTHIKRGGRTTPQQWTVSLRDDSESKAWNYFYNWRNLIYPEILSRTPSIYKGTANLILLNPSSSNKRVYKLSGVWPMEVGPMSLDYETDNICIFSVTLSYDYFRMEND